MGLLFGAAKVLAIGAVGFGIAWWRSRARVRELEAHAHEVPAIEERLERIERSLDYISAHFGRIAGSSEGEERALPGSTRTQIED